jgi:circadian clock protein KaiB
LLRLYVAGATDRSRQAILRARQLCETEFNGNCELEVIDVYQQPILARDGQIVATPTLVKELPRPVRRFIGDLANTTGLFVGLDLHVKPKTKTLKVPSRATPDERPASSRNSLRASRKRRKRCGPFAPAKWMRW